MRTIGTWSIWKLCGKVMAGLVLATMIGGMTAGPAMAGHEGHPGGDGFRGGDRDGRRFEHRGRGHYRGDYRGRRVYRGYGYAEPVYVAPPVYYAPPPAPGVSIFLPTIHIR